MPEGLKTGAAAPEGKDHVSVGHLHDYVKGKVQTAAPTMNPSMFNGYQGAEIILAKIVRKELKPQPHKTEKCNLNAENETIYSSLSEYGTQNVQHDINSLFLAEEILSELSRRKEKINFTDNYLALVRNLPEARAIIESRKKIGLKLFGQYTHKNKETQEFIRNQVSKSNKDFRAFLENFLT